MIFLIALFFFTAQVDDARTIYEELDARRNAIVYETATLQMRIVDQRGRVRERELESWSYSKDVYNKTFVRFVAPADVRGTGFLTIKEGPSEVQRLFLPALNRVQTISSAQKGDRFMGSDFTYEDMGDMEPDNFDFETIERNDADNRILIKATANESGSYAVAHFLIDTQRFVLISADYFNTENQLLRQLLSDDIVEVRDGIWRANKLTMKDVKTGRYSEIIWKSRTLDEPIQDVIFTERNLIRG